MEYGEMMRQFVRFCRAQAALAEYAGMNFQCEGCPLEKNKVCNDLPNGIAMKDVADVERVVTAWAAEHPEPVYPTWGEWLEAQGVFKKRQLSEYASDRVVDWEKVTSRIPEGFARRHGIAPVAQTRREEGRL